MKKLLLLIILFLSCLTANAQQEDYTLVTLAKVSFEGLTELYQWTSFSGDGTDATIEIVDDGLAINNPRMQEKDWYPQLIVVPDGSFNLEEGHDYIVRLTVKVPSDGTYMMNIGNWGTNYSCHVPVTASDDYQIIDTEYPEYGRSTENAHVLFGCGWVTGTTIIKEVEVLEKTITTGIQSVKSAKDAKDAIYNLVGQKVSTSYKGIVIKKGKRVVVR